MVMWIIGLSGAGKTTLAKAVVEEVRKRGKKVVLIDGDVIREVFGNDLGHSLADRRKNADRISRLCQFLSHEGIHVVCAVLSLFHESQIWNRENIVNYYQVFIDVPFDELVRRDSKKLYSRALKGEIENVAGVDIEFKPPSGSDRVIRNDRGIDGLLGEVKALAALFD